MNSWLRRFGLSPTGVRWLIILVITTLGAAWIIPHENLHIFSYQVWYGLIGLAVTMLVGMFASIWQKCVKRHETYYRDR